MSRNRRFKKSIVRERLSINALVAGPSKVPGVIEPNKYHQSEGRVMRKIICQLLLIFLLALQSNAAEYQFVSASPRLTSQERVKLGTVAVVATRESARYGFEKSKGRVSSAAVGAGNTTRAVLEKGFSSGDGLAATASIALAPFAAVVGALSEGTRKVAPGTLTESEAELTDALAEMANQSRTMPWTVP
jgi:hypothetical protein